MISKTVSSCFFVDKCGNCLLGVDEHFGVMMTGIVVTWSAANSYEVLASLYYCFKIAKIVVLLVIITVHLPCLQYVVYTPNAISAVYKVTDQRFTPYCYWSSTSNERSDVDHGRGSRRRHASARYGQTHQVLYSVLLRTCPVGKNSWTSLYFCYKWLIHCLL